jgi:ADP-heptose:LPS heptosyltransferase
LTESSNQYITVQPNAGWSKYKQWDADRWKQVRRAMAGVRFMTIDASAGRTLAQSIALFANARMHIGIDSFCNHLTNYFWTDEHGNGRRVPGVILWGSTQASAAGYPHNTNISLGLPCQPCFRENPDISRMSRGPCINPPRSSYNGEDGDTPWACMDGISVDMVVDAVRKMWEETA